MGVLGHVDSGKTSLTRALSTVASTASMDKSPQSKERGITLDLGFSSFLMDVPAHLVAQGSEHEQMQITLVDCPGHASLIRTIIGGAQIIDLMLLVIDVGKGIQTQTSECIVIGEITNDRLIVVLNKLDVLPAATREADLEKMKARIRKTLSTTKFADAPMVAVAAHPGGGTDYADAKPPPETTGGVIGAEPAAESGAGDALAACAAPTTAPEGIAELLAALRAQIVLPQRDPDGPLLFAIDHCFPIKGQGTVVTGTVLSGSMGVGMEIDFPELKQTRKIKSMQMFKKPVNKATQGDRVGVCVTQLDSKALERGIACTQGHVTLISAALVSVRQIRFFKAAPALLACMCSPRRPISLSPFPTGAPDSILQGRLPHGRQVPYHRRAHDRDGHHHLLWAAARRAQAKERGGARNLRRGEGQGSCGGGRPRTHAAAHAL